MTSDTHSDTSGRRSAGIRPLCGLRLALAVTLGTAALACNMVPVSPHPGPEVRIVKPLAMDAIGELRSGDSKRKVMLELGEPHAVSPSDAGGQTWRYWAFRPAFQVSAQAPPRQEEGYWAAFQRWYDAFLFVPSRQPYHVSRVVVPSESWELVINFDERGELLTSRFQSLKRPLGK